jgi:hypothetical protein
VVWCWCCTVWICHTLVYYCCSVCKHKILHVINLDQKLSYDQRPLTAANTTCKPHYQTSLGPTVYARTVHAPLTVYLTSGSATETPRMSPSDFRSSHARPALCAQSTASILVQPPPVSTAIRQQARTAHFHPERVRPVKPVFCTNGKSQ